MEKVSKESVNYRPADTISRSCGTCVMFHHGICDLVLGKISSSDTCDRWEAKVEKSEQTPVVSTVHHPLGTHGLWGTPSKKVPEKQQLPAYIQNIARALMRDHGMEESQAISTAVNAVKRWAQGNLGEAHGHVHPEVQQAAQRALDEWEKLRASHEG
jgi:hypothetical protein